MFWKTINLLLSGGVVAVTFWRFQRTAHFVLAAAAVVVATTIFNFFFLKRRAPGPQQYFRMIVPDLFLAGLFGVMAAVSSDLVKIFLGLAGAVWFYVEQILLPQQKREAFTLASGILLLTSLWAWIFFFTPEWWIVLLAVFGLFFGLFWQAFFEARPEEGRQSVVRAITGALILVEFTWTLLFFPFHFLTLAALDFVVFYLIYVLSMISFAQTLSKKRIWFHVGIAIFLLVASLLSSTWKPLS